MFYIAKLLELCNTLDDFARNATKEEALAMLCMFTDMVASSISEKSIDVLDLIRQNVAEVNDMLGAYEFV